jgi:phosphoenolpyruvate synthase/pyruvate phosphate dikinase
MAVVAQQMVPSDVSGIMFGARPGATDRGVRGLT